MEQLAVRLSQAIVANQKIYERLMTDIRAIRKLVPAVESVVYQPTDDGNTLIVSLNSMGRMLRALGLYKQWGCLNSHYRLEQLDSVRNSVLLHFHGTYDLKKLAQLYAKLPGVEAAEPNALIAIGDRRTLCVTREDADWHYVILSPRVQLYHFVSTPTGGMTVAGEWVVPESADEFERSRPSWVTEYWNAEACS